MFGYLIRYNLYGAPEYKNDGLLGNIKKGVKAVGDAVNEAAGLYTFI